MKHCFSPFVWGQFSLTPKYLFNKRKISIYWIYKQELDRLPLQVPPTLVPCNNNNSDNNK